MLIRNVNIATMLPGSVPYGQIKCGAIVLAGDQISWVGEEQHLPAEYLAYESIDFDGRLVTPGLIDCHTHLVYAGNRALEFEMRLQGASYEAIASSGGGIVSTVSATRQTSESDLLQSALQRVDALLAEGVCTIEIKSGYGLDIETELKMLRVARAIEQQRQVHIRTSFLGAHTVPPEYKGRADVYLQEVCLPAMYRAASEGLIDAVDGFCENIAFDIDQIQTVFDAAKALGLPVKLHAEQLSNLQGASLAADYAALSVDHLEYIDEAAIRKLAQSGTIAVMLPGAYYSLQASRRPPIELFREHAVPMALATDCNPGSSPLNSLLLAMNMGSTLFGLTPEESLAGTTRNAARALDLNSSGAVARGNRADLAVWNVNHPAELSYHVGFNPLHTRIFGGVL